VHALLALEIFGIKLIGVSPTTGRKLLVTIIFLAVLWTITQLVRWLIRVSVPQDTRPAFWARQFVSIAAALITVLALASIWFDNAQRATTVIGLFTAGLAFALQRVVTAIAGYLLILRGRMYNVGDRIKMGGVRGDVMRIGFLQTMIMEMGQPPAEQQETPGMWVEPASTAAASSASRTRRSSTSRSTTTRAISPICGRRCAFRSATRTIARAPSRSSSKRHAVMR
jgi:small-conductance mechanosensitive channel